MSKQTDLAEVQLLGYKHGNQGYCLKSLVESMGLIKSEWDYMKIKYKLSYLNEDEIYEIDEAVKLL